MTAISSFLSGVWRGFGAKDLGADLHQVAVESNVGEDIQAATASAKPTGPFPGPWAFFTSAYMLGLVVMAILMHRIQHIVVPPPQTHHPNRNLLRNRARLRLRRCDFIGALYTRLLPLDITRTSTRLLLHLPTLYWMSRMLVLWSVLLVQSMWDPEYTPSPSGDGEEDLRTFLSSTPLFTYVAEQRMSVIAWSTFCAVCGAFCVEGFVKGLGGLGHMQANTSPFNLVGYAFLLHIYSSPLTHNVHPPSPLPSRPDKHVIFTILVPLLQLALFHILSIKKRWSTHRLGPTALSSALSLTHFWVTLLGRKAGGRYPLLNYIPNIFESVLILTTLLTAFLNGLTQLLLLGRISRPLGLNAGGDWEEDFGVLLLRVGTATLEATGLRGWGNEVAGVVAPHRQSALVLGRNGVLTNTTRRRRETRGWTNEVKQIEIPTPDSNVVVGITGVVGISRGWLRETIRWARAAGRVSLGAGLAVMGRKGSVLDQREAPPPQASHREQEQDEDHVYQRFLRGEDEGSEDDGSWSDDAASSSEEESEQDEHDAEDISGLYSDLGGTGETLLQHMAHAGPGVLTRRGVYSFDAPAPSPLDIPTLPGSGATLDLACVICTSAPREVVAWPCRCLAMCDSCRSQLAIRSGSSGRCPCCRGVVEGYSRVYVP
ncbi:hypothetical protein BDZ89DRAFT_1232998 [Hymenopellis radicata]|nr:hypothetical protein BDZ89DRAFT_1232998 [Hymenopellis radicata]